MNRKYLYALLPLAMWGCKPPLTPSNPADPMTPVRRGIALPTEISAVPSSGQSPSRELGRRSGAQTAEAGASDYDSAQSVRFVREAALDQFGPIKQILQALAQTHYADAENIGAGPYLCMISWQEESAGNNSKQLQRWIVESDLVDETNVVRVWIDQDGLGGVRAEFKITQAPTLNSDGSYDNYGAWTLNARMGPQGESYFMAEASVGSDGETILKMHQSQGEPGGPQFETRGMFKRTAEAGFGKIEYPDWSSCQSPDCVPSLATATYVYDANTLAVASNGETLFKSRTNPVDVVQRYGLFDAATGANVEKSHDFGFPLQFTDSDGRRGYGYYGAWQGRHQLWANGQGLPEGTVVTRQDRGANAGAQTYTVSRPFIGTLVKRTLVQASVQDVRNVPVETWVNDNFTLHFDGEQWVKCLNPDYSTQPMTCGEGSSPFADLATLAVSPGDTRRNVFINGWDTQAQEPRNYVYRSQGSSGAGFYVATFNPNGPPTPTDTLYTPVQGDQLHVGIGGSIFIEFDGTQWQQKKLISFDQQSWTPTFDAAGDIPFTPDLGREYYLNVSGVSYVVTRTGAASYDAKIELQSVPNPTNASTFVSADTRFKPQWGSEDGSTYRFVTDPNDSNFMKLVYDAVGARDAESGAMVGAVVEQGQWGLLAYVGDTNTGMQFNWDYPPPEQNWGAQQYLLSASGEYELLDDQLRFAAITLRNRAGEDKTLTLGFDGWLHGLPDAQQELQRNHFNLSEQFAAKLIAIPGGTVLTNADDASKRYRVKPLEICQYLQTTDDPGTLELPSSASVDLSTTPVPVDNGVGPMPQLSNVRYSEGKRVE